MDKVRAYRIELDGQAVGRINAGQTVEIRVATGEHSIVAKIDWCGSPPLNFDIREGETLQFECGSNLQGLRIFLALVYVFFLRHQYLTLTRI